MAGRAVPIAERFWDKTEPEPNSACVLWLGATVKSGSRRYYGSVGTVRPHTALAHRVAFELAGGVIPPGLDVMHTCDTTLCVNPAHLRIGSRADNMRDCVEKGRHVAPNADPARCRNGHEYNAPNDYRDKSGHRRCRVCRSAGMHAAYWRDPEASRRYHREWSAAR